VRQDADLEGALDRLLDIYRRALDEHARSDSSAPASVASIEAQRAAARHLCSIASRVKDAEALTRKAASLSEDVLAARTLTETLANERGTLQESLARAHREAQLAREEAQRVREEAWIGREFEHRRLDELQAMRAAVAQQQEALAEQQRIVAQFRALPTIRMRDAVIRVPLLGATARRAARWLARAL
jgi:hypothetical protein